MVSQNDVDISWDIPTMSSHLEMTIDEAHIIKSGEPCRCSIRMNKVIHKEF